MYNAATGLEEDPTSAAWSPASSVPDLDLDGLRGAAPAAPAPMSNGAPIVDDVPEVTAPVPPMPGSVAQPEPAPEVPPPAAPTTPPASTEPQIPMQPVEFKPEPLPDPSTAVPAKPAGARQKVVETVMSPEKRAIASADDKLTEQKVIAERNASQVRQAQADDEAKAAARREEIALEKKRQTDLLLQDHQQRLEAAQARNQEALENWKAAKFHDYWADKSTGDRIIAAFAAALGGFGGRRNDALEIINGRIKADYEQQKAEIDKKAALYEATSKDIDRARVYKADAINDLNAKFSAASDAVAAQLEKMKTARGVPAEQAASDKTVLGIYETGNKFKQTLAQDTNTKVEWDTYTKAKGGGTGGGNPKDNAEYLRMLERGASPAELESFAAKHHIDEKLQDKLVNRGEKLATNRANRDARDERDAAKSEKDAAAKDARTLYDPATNRPVALMPTARVVAQAGKDMVAGQEYSRALHELADDIETHGRTAGSVLGLSTEARTRRLRLARDAQAKGRVSSGINATDAGAKMEHEMLGGAGVGLETMASPEQLRKLAEDVDKRTLHRVRAMGTPLDGNGITLDKEGAPPAPRAPKSDDVGPPSFLNKDNDISKKRQERARLASQALTDPDATEEDRDAARKILKSLGRR